jgi:hypothetical protein
MRQTIILFLLLLLISCNQDNKMIGRKAINNLSKAYECTGFIQNIDMYQYSMSLVNKDNLEIQLWNRDIDYNNQNIIVFIYHEKGYAIPVFPNVYEKYWNFQLENIQDDTSNINTTFQHEYFLMLKKLEIIDSVRIAAATLTNVFKNVLNSRLLQPSDSSTIIDKISFSGYNLGETDSICTARKSEILKMVYNRIYKSEGIHEYNAYWDEKNDRIYQVDFDSLRLCKEFNPSLKVYRLGCNINILEM